MGLTGLIFLGLVAQPVATVAVEGSTLAPALAAALAEELGADRLRPAGEAELRALLNPTVGGWSLEVFERGGRPILSRVLGLRQGPSPALRVATLLVAEAARSRASTGSRPDESVAPPEPKLPRGGPEDPPRPPTLARSVETASVAAPLGLRLGILVMAGIWPGPSAGRAGFGLSAGLLLPFGFVQALGSFGFGPTIQGAAVEADLVELHLGGELGLALLRAGPFTGFVALGVGYGRTSGQARAVVYAGPGTPSDTGGLGALEVTAALEVQLQLSAALDLALRAGARLTPTARRVAVPATFPQAEALQLPRVEPTLALTLGWRLF